jgi:hypothetical protein
LCTKCHALVHSNKHYWQPILKEMINKWMKSKNIKLNNMINTLNKWKI